MSKNTKNIFNILSILLLLFGIQWNLKATNIINNKDILININGTIETKKIFNKQNNTLENNSILLEIDAKTKKQKNISTFGKLIEYIDANNKNSHISNKLIYIGVKHNKIGKIKVGKYHSMVYNSLSYTNISPYFKSKIFKDNSLTGINDNLITYKKTFKLNNKNFLIKNITLTGEYQGKNNTLNKQLYSIKNGWGIGYNIKTNNGMEISSAYANQNINKENKINYNENILNNFKSNISSAWSTSIKYNLDKFYIAYSYIEGNNLNLIKVITNSNNYNKYKFINKTQNINLIAKYNFNSGFTPIIGYTQTTFKNLDKTKYHGYYTPYNQDIEKYFNIGATYKFNKSFFGYIDYKINQFNNNCKNNNFTLGFIYKF